MTGSHHERLARLMDERRLELGMSWEQVAAAAGVSVATLRAIRNGSSKPAPLTRRGIERTLKWASGSIEDVLDGEQPTIAGSGAIEGRPALTAHGTPGPHAEEEDDPKIREAQRLIAEAQALLAEIQEERRRGA